MFSLARNRKDNESINISLIQLNLSDKPLKFLCPGHKWTSRVIQHSYEVLSQNAVSLIHNFTSITPLLKEISPLFKLFSMNFC